LNATNFRKRECNRCTNRTKIRTRSKEEEEEEEEEESD
jgi:hypothetical protein